MRYVIFGAGAVGGTIGAQLHLAGRDVAVIARGAHLDAIRTGGLRLRDPRGEHRVRVASARSVREAGLNAGDVVVLAVKSQDTAAALAELAECGADVVVACAQNGVDNERQALRHFERVLGVWVWLPSQHLEPGVVEAFATSPTGVLDVGAAPHGRDPIAARVAADLSDAGFSSREVADVMRWKWAKLLDNLANAVEATLGAGPESAPIAEQVRDEGARVLRAARIDFATEEEVRERLTSGPRVAPVLGRDRSGGSTWQSLARATGRIETDWLNGEIVLLGRVHDVPTPMNTALRRLASSMARERRAPGTASPAELEAALALGPGASG